MTDQSQPITHRRLIIFDCDLKQVDWSGEITTGDLFAAGQAMLNIAGSVKISLTPTPPAAQPVTTAQS